MGRCGEGADVTSTRCGPLVEPRLLCTGEGAATGADMGTRCGDAAAGTTGTRRGDAVATAVSGTRRGDATAGAAAAATGAEAGPVGTHCGDAGAVRGMATSSTAALRFSGPPAALGKGTRMGERGLSAAASAATARGLGGLVAC